MLNIEDPTVTVKCRTAIKVLFLYFNLCLKCKIGYFLKSEIIRKDLAVNGHKKLSNFTLKYKLK
jgi:hypothetical protein